MVAFQLAGKATRDALFLSTFGVRALPRMVIVAAGLSALVAILLSKVLARVGPGRLVPRLFGLSALLLLVEWSMATSARPVIAALFYIHFSCLGALLVSGFWGLVTERFDPRTARATIGRIAAGGSVGGLIGGVLPARFGASLPVSAMLPVLAGLHILSAILVYQVRPASGSRSANLPGSATRGESAAAIFKASSYLRALVLLVALSSAAEGLLDYVFKARATASEPAAGELLQLFAVFYTATALLTILVQTVALKGVLSRLGIARSAALLPAGVSIGALGGMFFIGLPAMIVARCTEIVLRNSIFRGAYELLFGPVPPREKRATKLLVDVGAARLGDALAGGLIQVTLLLTLGSAVPILLAATVLVAIGALFVARQLHRGYVQALERSLTLRADQVPVPVGEDLGALLQSVGGFDLTEIQAQSGRSSSESMARPAVATVDAPVTATDTRAAQLESADPEVVRLALDAGPLTEEEVELAIPLLAWDEVAPDAIRALGAASQRVTGQLVKHLLEPEEDFAIRRRLVAVLAESPTPEAFEGLLKALDDQRFEVRFRAGRALHKLRREIPGLVPDRERILKAVLNEVTVGRGVWESRELLDSTDDVWAPMEVDFLRHRANRSLEHVFTLLALVLPAEPLRLAYHGLHTEDRNLRGTSLEYLESVLPERIREKLWPFLEPQGRRPGPHGRDADQVLDNLLASRESIVLALAEIRKRGSTPEPRPPGE